MNTKKNLATQNDPVAAIIKARVSLAPMAGVADYPFRMIARKFGCKFAFTEMIDVNGIVYNNRKSFRLIEKKPGDEPIGVQVAGEDEKKILYVAKLCEEKGFDLIDINAGCPVKKVIRHGKGAALLKDPVKLGRIVETLVKALNIPVTVKIRSGWDENSLNYLEVAKTAASSGASAVCIHPRTKDQMYKGKADQAVVRHLKEEIEIPVFASGNIFSAQDVLDTLNRTGCDAVFVARGALGKPWIFRDVENLFSGKTEITKPSFMELKDTMIEHFSLAQEYYGAFTAAKRMYKHVTWYLKGYKDLNEIMRKFIKGVKNLEDFQNFLGTL